MIKLLLMIFMLQSCAHAGDSEVVYSRKLRYWIGQNTQSLYNTWGYPMKKISLGNGKFLAVYYQKETPPDDFSFNSIEYDNLLYNDYGTSQYLPLFHCKTTFLIEQNIVTNYSFSGNDCF